MHDVPDLGPRAFSQARTPQDFKWLRLLHAVGPSVWGLDQRRLHQHAVQSLPAQPAARKPRAPLQAVPDGLDPTAFCLSTVTAGKAAWGRRGMSDMAAAGTMVYKGASRPPPQAQSWA